MYVNDNSLGMHLKVCGDRLQFLFSLLFMDTQKYRFLAHFVFESSFAPQNYYTKAQAPVWWIKTIIISSFKYRHSTYWWEGDDDFLGRYNVEKNISTTHFLILWHSDIILTFRYHILLWFIDGQFMYVNDYPLGTHLKVCGERLQFLFSLLFMETQKYHFLAYFVFESSFARQNYYTNAQGAFSLYFEHNGNFFPSISSYEHRKII